MKAIENLIRNVRVFNDNLVNGSFIQRIVQDNDNIIVDWNAESQLFEEGEDATGKFIASYAPYTPYTKELKRLKGQPYDRVTLRDEGDFHSSMFVDADRQKFEIKASDWKTKELMHGYGDTILGLQMQYQRELARDYIYPALCQIVRKTILNSKWK